MGLLVCATLGAHHFLPGLGSEHTIPLTGPQPLHPSPTPALFNWYMVLKEVLLNSKARTMCQTYAQGHAELIEQEYQRIVSSKHTVQARTVRTIIASPWLAVCRFLRRMQDPRLSPQLMPRKEYPNDHETKRTFQNCESHVAIRMRIMLCSE